MKIQCPHCGKLMKVRNELAGKIDHCPNIDCKKEFLIPPPPNDDIMEQFLLLRNHIAQICSMILLLLILGGCSETPDHPPVLVDMMGIDVIKLRFDKSNLLARQAAAKESEANKIQDSIGPKASSEEIETKIKQVEKLRAEANAIKARLTALMNIPPDEMPAELLKDLTEGLEIQRSNPVHAMIGGGCDNYDAEISVMKMKMAEIALIADSNGWSASFFDEAQPSRIVDYNYPGAAPRTMTNVSQAQVHVTKRGGYQLGVRGVYSFGDAMNPSGKPSENFWNRKPKPGELGARLIGSYVVGGGIDEAGYYYACVVSSSQTFINASYPDN